MTKGMLFNSSTLQTVQVALRDALAGIVAGLAPGGNLAADLGISTGTAASTLDQDAIAGRLKFDAVKFAAAFDGRPRQRKAMLTPDGATAADDGIAQRISDLALNFTKSGGVISAAIDGSNDQVKRLQDQIDDMNLRLQAREDAAEGAVHGDGDGDRPAEDRRRQPDQRAQRRCRRRTTTSPRGSRATIGRPRRRALTPRVDRRRTAEPESARMATTIRRSDELLPARTRALADVMKIRFYPFSAASARGVRMTDADGRELPRHDRLGRRRPDRLRPPGGARGAIVAALDGQHTAMLCCHSHAGRPPSSPSSCARCCRATSRRRPGSARPARTRTTASRGCCRSRPADAGWSRSSAATTARPAARRRCRGTRRRRR